MKMRLKSWELTRAPAWQKLPLVLATGFGAGLSPMASGTVGTLPGLLLMAVLAPVWRGPLVWQVVVALGCCLLAVPLCDLAEKHFGKKDDGRIVADEYLTFPLCLIGLPLTPWMLACAFFTHRVFDVLKPPPARRLQDLPGGWGIVADDVFSGLYSLCCNHLIFWLAEHWLRI